MLFSTNIRVEQFLSHFTPLRNLKLGFRLSSHYSPGNETFAVTVKGIAPFKSSNHLTHYQVIVTLFGNNIKV